MEVGVQGNSGANAFAPAAIRISPGTIVTWEWVDGHHNVIAPLKPGAFERTQLENLRRDLEEIGEEHPVDPELVMVAPTMVDRTTNLSRTFVDDLEDAYPEQAAATAVSKSQDVSKKQQAG